MGLKLRVLSANLWNGRGEPEAFADLVAALHVDIVAVQECGTEQARALEEVMPHGLIHPSPNDSGMGLLMKRPAEVRRVPLPHRGAYSVQLTPEIWPGLEHPAEVLNVHFSAPHTYSPVPGLMLRPKQIRDFLSHLNTARPGEATGADTGGATGRAGQGGEMGQRIVVGDFNATPLWPLYRRMASQFTDAAIAVARQSGRPVERTWGPWFGAPRLLRIDHGFVTRGVRVDEFQVVAVRGSDHSAIVMDVLLD